MSAIITPIRDDVGLAADDGSMRIVLATDMWLFNRKYEDIDSWEMGLLSWEYRDEPEYEDYWSFENNVYLGHSDDKSIWGLVSLPWEPLDSPEYTASQFKAACPALLINPPKVREKTILQILLKVSNEVRRNGGISQKKIGEIFDSEPFAEYLPAGSYLPELPEPWLHLPAELSVGFIQSENTCLYPKIFKEYRRNTLKEALEVLYSPRLDGLLIEYALVVRDVVPLLSWDVDWPLSRQGKGVPYKRDKVDGVFPWEKVPNQKILAVYQWVTDRSLWSHGPPYYGEPRIRLSVGGLTQEEAVANWHQCARALRKLRPQSRNIG